MRKNIFTMAVMAAASMLLSVAAQASNGVNVSHLFNLSDFSGTVPYSDARLSVDRQHSEIYVIDSNYVRVYNESGMEVYRFGDIPALGSIRDLAVDEKGDLYVLSYDYSSSGPGSSNLSYSIIRCNYRGEPGKKIHVTGLPSDYSSFLPHILFYRDGRFLLVDRVRMQAAWLNKDGTFLKGYDFAALLEIPEKDKPNTEIFGFSVDNGGNLLFTVPVLFRAFRISPQGELSSFGKVGSAPGMFGIVTGIAADDSGHYLVSDSLRNVVMVFDENFRFLTEFGGYGNKPANLVRPRELALGNSGQLYVTQLRKRGVSVFSVISD